MKNTIDKIFLESIEKLKTGKLNYTKNHENNQILITENYFNEQYLYKTNITKCKEHKNIFEKLHAIKAPVLYWFEFDSSLTSSKDIRKEYEAYRENIKNKHDDINYRNTSSYKKKYKKDGNILYVGKVETGFWGRLVTHLGYAKSKKTAGVQLFHWYDIQKFGKLKLNYIVFEQEMKHLIVILEKELAIELEPLIGRY